MNFTSVAICKVEVCRALQTTHYFLLRHDYFRILLLDSQQELYWGNSQLLQIFRIPQLHSTVDFRQQFYPLMIPEDSGRKK